MLLLLKIIFWISVICLIHTYAFYPAILWFLTRNKQLQTDKLTDNWPLVSMLMSVYNEEKVIRQKMNSLIDLDYPKDRFRMYIGSDCSADRTNEILGTYAVKYPNIHFFPYADRNGKPRVINRLAQFIKEKEGYSHDHIFLMTDASVILARDTLKKLCRHFVDQEIKLVDANMTGIGHHDAGISKPETRYVSNEVLLKHREGLQWGKMIGPFGGCYVIRSSHFCEVPPTFLVDDFYIAFKAFELGGKAINDMEAICYESVSHEIKEEYRRKSRISAGNFQNLYTFRHLLWPLTKPLGFAFFSHKVLRWLGPFFISFAFVSSGMLAFYGNFFYQILFSLQILLFIGIPILDFLLKQWNINIELFRSIRYFIFMNIALFHGFLKFIKGVKNNIWEPPKRNG